MTEPQSSSDSDQEPAADHAESLTDRGPSTGEPVPIEVWERTLDEVRRLSDELAAARERAARAEAEASFLREALGGKHQAPAASTASGTGADERDIFDVQDEPTAPSEDPEAEALRQEALRKAIAEQLRAYTERRSQERRRPWRRR